MGSLRPHDGVTRTEMAAPLRRRHRSTPTGKWPFFPTAITLLPPQQNQYALLGEIDLATDKGAVLAFAGSRLIVATADGPVRASRSNGGAWQIHSENKACLSPKRKQKPRSMLASPDGRTLAILFDDNKVWLYDLQHGRALAPRITGQGTSRP